MTPRFTPRFTPSFLAALAAAVLAGAGLSACAPVAVVGGAVGAGAVMVTGERRSYETQQADAQLEALGRDQTVQVLAGRGHVNVHSYFRKVLLTGETPTEQDRQAVEAVARALPGVQGVYNEVAVMPESSTLSRSSDGLTTSKVRTRLLNQNGVPSGAIKAVTERGTTYLMGRLTASEVALATEAVSQTDGVQRVVRLFDVIAAPTGGASGVITTGDGAAASSQGTPVYSGAGGYAAPQAHQMGQQATAAGQQAVQDAAAGVVTHPVVQPSFVPQQPSGAPIQVQTLPPVQ